MEWEEPPSPTVGATSGRPAARDAVCDTHTTNTVTTDTETPTCCYQHACPAPACSTPMTSSVGVRSRARLGSRTRQLGKQTDSKQLCPDRSRRWASCGHNGHGGPPPPHKQHQNTLRYSGLQRPPCQGGTTSNQRQTSERQKT